jgi:hypothetical protein
VAAETAAEIIRCVDVLAQGDRRYDPNTAAAVLGGVPVPEIKLSGLYIEFEATKRSLIAKMSEGQFRTWKNSKIRAIAILTEVIGDKSIRLTRDDALRFADHWESRVVDGEVVAETANRNITHITGMLSAVSRRHRLNLDDGPKISQHFVSPESTQGALRYRWSLALAPPA